MIYSRSAEYAISALVHMASLPEGEYALVREIAAQGAIPEHFLAKILQALARDGFLQSIKGPHGGFRLRKPPAEVSMLQIVQAVDGAGRYERCIGGNQACNDFAVCAMHDSWKTLRSGIIRYLEGTTVADLAAALGEKRRQLARSQRRGPRK